MQISFIYAGKKGSGLECTLALYSISKELGLNSSLILSEDNQRKELVQKLYPESEFINFFSPLSLLTLRKKLSRNIAFFTMVSPKILPVFLALKTPKIFYFHGTYDPAFSSLKLKDKIEEYLHDILITNSTITAATTPSLVKQVEHRLSIKAVHLQHPLYNKINPDFFKQEKNVDLPFKKGEYFLNFGDLSRASKGTNLLINAVDNTDLPVVLAGKMKETYNTKNIYHINRWVTDEELYWLVKNARAIVLPYLLRSLFSGCLALAFHFKKPVIAPNTEAFRELVIPGKTGWIFKYANIYSLKETMESVLQKPSFSKLAIIKKEKESARKTLRGLEKIIKKIEQIHHG